MMEEIIYREAITSDLDNLLALWKATRAEHKDWFEDYKVQKENVMELMADFFTECISSKNHILAVAESGKQLVGFVLAEIKDFFPPIYIWEKEGIIRNIYVNPDYRKKGIGEKLMLKAYSFFNDQIDIITVQTSVKNKSAINFYKKNDLEEFSMKMYKMVK